MASEQVASEWLVLVARRCRDPREALVMGSAGGFVHSLTFPVACPAADFPAGAVGCRNEGEKIGECGFIPAPEKH